MYNFHYITFSKRNFSSSEKYFSKTYNGKKLIGGVYRKSRFTEYTDIQYGTKKERSEHEQHLGLLGPVIRAEVGDVIRIILYNLSPNPVSIFLQGTSLTSAQSGKWLKEMCAYI